MTKPWHSHETALHITCPLRYSLPFSIVFPDLWRRLNNLLFSAFDQPWALHLLLFAMEKFLRSRPRAALMPCAVCALTSAWCLGPQAYSILGHSPCTSLVSVPSAGVWGSVGLCMPILCLIPRWPVNTPIILNIIFEHLFKPDTCNHSYLES